MSIHQIDITKFTATQLRRCVRDLIVLSRLPALRQGFDASEIAQSLAIALRAALDSEFASACWWNEVKGNPAQLIAIAGSVWGGADQRESEVGEWLRRGLHGASDSLSNTSLDGPSRLGWSPIALGVEEVVLASGSWRGAMNTASELTQQNDPKAKLLLLNETLEQRIVDRTAQLANMYQKWMNEIAERKHAEARYQEAQLEVLLASRLSAAGQMATALSHELNQPLTAAANSISAVRRILLGGDLAPRSMAIEVLGDAAAQVLRISQIVRRLRDFVVHRQVEKSAEDIQFIIEDSGALALSGCARAGVKIEYNFDQKAQFVFADKIQIEQVLTNLMRNAVDAMAENHHGEILISTHLTEAATVEIAVADGGAGVSADILHRLFEPFVTTKRNGSGLGLSISKSIIEEHGGSIWHEPNPSGGAIFKFTLPPPQSDECHAG